MKLLTAKELQERLGVAQAMAYRLVSSGEIANFKVGRSIRIDERDIESYLARHRREK